MEKPLKPDQVALDIDDRPIKKVTPKGCKPRGCVSVSNSLLPASCNSCLMLPHELRLSINLRTGQHHDIKQQLSFTI
jgi:hypothetical protein